MRSYILGALCGLFLILGYISFHPEISSMCSLGSWFNCGLVLNSSLSSLGLIPLWSLGLFWSVLTLLRYKKHDVFTGPWNMVGVLAAIFSLHFMIFNLKSICLLCAIADVLLISYAFFPLKKDKDILSDLPKDLGVALVFSLLSFTLLYFTKTPNVKTEKVTLLSSPLILGNPEGSKEIVVFTDFQCPACAKASELIHVLIKDPEVKVLIKNYPLSSQCNKDIKDNIHPWACEAAKLAYCTFEQGQFPAFYDLIYSIQDQIKNPQDLYSVLDDQIFKIDELKACVSGETSEDILQSDIFEANKVGIEGTPTFFYNGQQVIQWTNPYTWENISH